MISYLPFFYFTFISFFSLSFYFYYRNFKIFKIEAAKISATLCLKTHHLKDIFLLEMTLQDCCLTDLHIPHAKNIFFISKVASKLHDYDYQISSSQLFQK